MLLFYPILEARKPARRIFARMPLGAGLLDVARDRSLVRGIGAVPAAAAKQRDARCDIEEAGAKGPGAWS